MIVSTLHDLGRLPLEPYAAQPRELVSWFVAPERVGCCWAPLYFPMQKVVRSMNASSRIAVRMDIGFTCRWSNESVWKIAKFKPATDADTLNQPSALVSAMLNRAKQLPGLFQLIQRTLLLQYRF